MNKFRLTLFRGEIDGSSAGARGVAGRSSTLGVYQTLEKRWGGDRGLRVEGLAFGFRGFRG
jgi:hypothetical protein